MLQALKDKEAAKSAAKEAASASPTKFRPTARSKVAGLVPYRLPLPPPVSPVPLLHRLPDPLLS
eukprot:scaffold2485_cov92-Isochrysis_galbana.AAC.1